MYWNFAKPGFENHQDILIALALIILGLNQEESILRIGPRTEPAIKHSRQVALNAEARPKCRFSPEKRDQFFVKGVILKTDQLRKNHLKKNLKLEVLKKRARKPSRQPVQSVKRDLIYLLHQERTKKFFAMIVLKPKGPLEIAVLNLKDTKTELQYLAGIVLKNLNNFRKRPEPLHLRGLNSLGPVNFYFSIRGGVSPRPV